MEQITVVRACDYEALYVGDRLVWQDHTISVDELARNTNLKDLVQIKWADQDWFDEAGEYPMLFSQVRLEPEDES